MFPKELGVHQWEAVSLGGKSKMDLVLVWWRRVGQERHGPFQEVFPVPNEAAQGFFAISNW